MKCTKCNKGFTIPFGEQPYKRCPAFGEPYPMLEWVRGLDENAEDKFHDVWEQCLRWNA